MALTDQVVGMLKQFQQQHEQVSLELTTDHLHGVQDHLIKEKSDIAIGPSYGLDDRHVFIEIGALDLVCVVHPKLLPTLQQGHQKVKPQALYSLPHILVSQDADNQGHRFLLPAGKRWYVNDFQVKKTLIQAGLGWARMPYYMVRDALEEGRLVRMDVENFISHNQTPLYMIRLRQQALNHEANLFWRFMKQALKRPIIEP